MIKRGTSCEVIPLSNIVYCEVQGRKLYIHQDDGNIVDYYDKLENFEHQLTIASFGVTGVILSILITFGAVILDRSYYRKGTGFLCQGYEKGNCSGCFCVSTADLHEKHLPGQLKNFTAVVESAVFVLYCYQLI